MEDHGTHFVSATTLVILLFGIIIAGAFLHEFIFIPVIVWSICIAVLFLGEFLFGKMKKRFSSNLGALIAGAVMGAVFTVWVLIKAPFALSELEWWLACMSILPPMIVSLAVNIGNIIYKLTRRKADEPSDRQT